MNEEMREATINFPNQIERALEIAKNSRISNDISFDNILISGLGGSGIGASIVTNWVSSESQYPIVINKGYFLPEFANENTLVICCSYSGNTEETLKVLEEADCRKCQIVCVSSGGKMIEISKEKNYEYIQIDGGMQPRACLGYSLVQLVHVLVKKGVVSEYFVNEIEAVPALIRKYQNQIDADTKELSDKIFDKLPIIYSDEILGGVAERYRQQINENSKMLCWHHVIPEMNHNEMVGWRDKNDNLAVLFLESGSDYIRNKQRRSINSETISKYTPNIYNIASKGDNLIERSMYHIHFCDLLSIHLAVKRGFESKEIEVINHLKGTLEGMPW